MKTPLPLVLAGFALLPLALFACRSDSGASARAKAELTRNEAGEPVGLEHYRRWSDKIAQGGEPVGEVAFENLAALGIRTVLSVDGAATDVETAHEWGLRYVHIPIGYDGITDEQALEIVKAVEASEGPVYVHCHHGLHRGPAAAGIARIGVDGLDAAQALKDLEASGCSRNYPGLYRDVGKFSKPSAAVLAAVSADLPEVRVPVGVKASMSYIDRRWDFVNAGAKAHWGKLEKHPDVDVAHEAGMIENTLRSLVADHGKHAADARFVEMMKAAHTASVELETAIRAHQSEQADAAHKRLKNACDACHEVYRNDS